MNSVVLFGLLIALMVTGMPISISGISRLGITDADQSGDALTHHDAGLSRDRHLLAGIVDLAAARARDDALIGQVPGLGAKAGFGPLVF